MGKKTKALGRPRKEIDFNLFERLCKVQGSLVWIAAFLEISPRTLVRRVEEHYRECPECGELYTDEPNPDVCRECGCKIDDLKPRTFGKVSEVLKGFGKMGVMQKQFMVGLKGNPKMLIHLGKNYCGQSEKSEVEHTVKGPLVIMRSKKDKEVGDEDRED